MSVDLLTCKEASCMVLHQSTLLAQGCTTPVACIQLCDRYKHFLDAMRTCVNTMDGLAALTESLESNRRTSSALLRPVLLPL